MTKVLGDETLLPSQKNAIYPLIEKAGLAPTSFRWEEGESSDRNGKWRTSVLRCNETPYFCEFRIWRNWSISCAPGNDRRREVLHADTWQKALWNVARWLGWVKRELHPDLWSEIVAAEPDLLNASLQTGSNRPFSSPERKQIEAAVTALKEKLQLNVTDPDRFHLIEERLEQLNETAQRLGRKDWITLALGVLMQVIVASSISPEAARELLRAAAQLLRWVWSGAPLLP